jgi:hypothetical protein
MGLRALDPERYGELRAEAVPKVIANDREFHRMAKTLEDLAFRADPRPEETALAELLARLVQDYDDRRHRLPSLPPHKMIDFPMEQRGLRQAGRVLLEAGGVFPVRADSEMTVPTARSRSWFGARRPRRFSARSKDEALFIPAALAPCYTACGAEVLINGKKIVVVLPAYNAEKTLEVTVRELPEIVDERILVDDHSSDATAALARKLGLTVEVHPQNRGYGGNQKTCYAKALAEGADVVVMLHPDYQYNPLLVTPIATMIAYGVYDLALGSRILGAGALRGGMPLYKYISNRFLTAFQNLMMGAKLSEYHTGFRAFSRELLETLPLEENSDDFVFDNQMLAQAVLAGARFGEISCPTRYFAEASSINFRRSTIYGLGVLKTSVLFRLARWGVYRSRIFRFPARPAASGLD